MKMSDLENFLELARASNVTHAADSLGMTQPALSRSLARLEHAIGNELFDRHGRRLQLNRYGEVLVPHAARAVSEIQDARARIAALQDPGAGVISLSFVTSFGSWLVPALVESYRQIVPGVQFILNGSAADNVISAVRDGGADIGFLAPQPEASDLTWTELVKEPLALSLPHGHPLSGCRKAGIDELRSLEYAMLRPEFGLRQITDAYFSALGITPKNVIEATEVSTLRALVASGVGVAIMPVERTLHRNITQIPLEVPASRPAGMIVSAHRGLAPAAAQFLRFITEEVADMSWE